MAGCQALPRNRAAPFSFFGGNVEAHSQYTISTKLIFGRLARGDSNPHGFPHHPLKGRLFARGLQSVRLLRKSLREDAWVSGGHVTSSWRFPIRIDMSHGINDSQTSLLAASSFPPVFPHTTRDYRSVPKPPYIRGANNGSEHQWTTHRMAMSVLRVQPAWGF